MALHQLVYTVLVLIAFERHHANGGEPMFVYFRDFGLAPYLI